MSDLLISDVDETKHKKIFVDFVNNYKQILINRTKLFELRSHRDISGKIHTKAQEKYLDEFLNFLYSLDIFILNDKKVINLIKSTYTYKHINPNYDNNTKIRWKILENAFGDTMKSLHTIYDDTIIKIKNMIEIVENILEDIKKNNDTNNIDNSN